MEIEFLQGEFCVCKVVKFTDEIMKNDFVFIAKTDEENSIVCRVENMPDCATDVEKGWNLFRISGQLDFALIGILSKVSSILAENGVSVFAVSTYNTDYFLIKSENIEKVKRLFINEGINIK